MAKSLAYAFIKLQWEQGKLPPEQMQSLVERDKPLITQAEADEIMQLPQQ